MIERVKFNKAFKDLKDLKKGIKKNKLAKMSEAEIDAEVDRIVVDIASAKEYLKKLTKLIVQISKGV